MLASHSWSLNYIAIFDTQTGQQIRQLVGHEEEVNALTVLPDGRLASASDDKTIRVWDVRSGKCERVLQSHTNDVYSLATLPDGRLASGSRSNTVKVWNPITGQCELTLQDAGEVYGVVPMSGGRLASMANMGYDIPRNVRIWDLKNGQVECDFQVHHEADGIAVLPDGRMLVPCDEQGLQIYR